MKPRASFLLLGLIILFAASLPARSQITTGTVTYKSGRDKVTAYLAIPETSAPYSAIIVVHEWWGLNEQIKGQARKLAQEGYLALAIDLYRGRVATDRDQAQEISRALPEDRARRDLRAAFKYLAKRKDVRKDRVASMGWCMGGGYSLQLALLEPKLAASIIYYGRLATEESALQKIRGPVLGFFGGQDRGIPVEQVREFETQLKLLGKKVEVHIYPGAGHAFANETGPSYNARAAWDAWAKMLAFLAEHLL